MIAHFALLLSLAIRLNADISFTIADYDLMCRCVMSEAGNQSFECQEAVATVILNRAYCTDKYPDTVQGVITQKNQFSVVDNGYPTEQVKLAVLYACLKYGTVEQDIPKACYYFRSGHYHSFGINYKQIDDMYFSLAEDATD